MSIKRIVLGMGGAGTITVGVWFGLNKKQAHDHYKAKMDGFRKIAQKVNGYLSSNSSYKTIVLADPEHSIWETKFNYYSSQGWNKQGENWNKAFPKEARKSKETMRDFCFQKIAENSDDAKEESNISFDNRPPEGKEFWDPCLALKWNLE